MDDTNQNTNDDVIKEEVATPESLEDAGQATMTTQNDDTQADPQDQPVTDESNNQNDSAPIESESENQNASEPENHIAEASDLSDQSEASETQSPSESSDASETEETTEAKAEDVAEIPAEDQPEADASTDQATAEDAPASSAEEAEKLEDTSNDDPNAKWYVVHTYSGHENKVATALKQRVESEHLEHKILDVIVPTQDKIEIRSGKKSTVKEKIFPGYILVKMILDDGSWLAVRTTQGVTSFVGIGNKPTPIPDAEVKTIVRFMTQGAAPTFKDVFMVNDTVKIIDGPFSEFIGKVDGVDKEKGKVKVLVSIFGRETPVELDFLQVNKL